ncbi:DciA family protein [Brachybacterium sp. YJGR34]|uniref:DciA family protein n=1 Tax=Brachybacterium sp. YJGR34 TaxID=2059911 RepID=UPI000E0B864E|nr:DciA family protein [Brachybacterium sp. YJGR34]
MTPRRPGGEAQRPRVANPYDLSTWSGPAPAADREAAPRVPVRAADEETRTASSPDPRARDADSADAEERIFFDPPELPAPSDPFELARRTVNRSRAAARDRGLFPISAKTQARDVRDRSGRSPGYSGSRPDPRDPQGIEIVLRTVLGNLGWSAGMTSGRVLEEWDQIVGERISAHCRPVSFEDGVLVVSASSSAWASQLRMLTPQLITTIEEHVGSHAVSELKVTGPAAAERSWKKGRRTVTWRGPRDTYG